MRSPSAILSIVLSFSALHAQTSALDSLELHKLSLEVASADEKVVATDLIHRLMPRVMFSVSFGTRNVLFADPGGGPPGFLPADAWRVTVVVPLSELFNSESHDLAMIERARKTVDLNIEKLRRGKERRDREYRLGVLRQELLLLSEEYEILTRIVRFQKILFEEGKTNFDALARSELQTIEARLKLVRAESQLRDLSME